MATADKRDRLAQVDEIDDTFGDVDFTCQPCRMRALRKDLFRMNYTQADLQKTDMLDTFQAYSEFGEGSVTDIAATIAGNSSCSSYCTCTNIRSSACC